MVVGPVAVTLLEGKTKVRHQVVVVIEVADVKPIAIGERVIEAGHVLIYVLAPGGIKVQYVPRGVRQRKEQVGNCNSGLRDPILRNHIVRKGNAGGGIYGLVLALRKVSRHLQRCGHRTVRSGTRLHVAQRFPRKEKEALVMLYRTAQAGSELILLQRILGQEGSAKEVLMGI